MDRRLREFLLSPQPYILLFLFFEITSLNTKVTFLRDIHAELLLVIAITFLSLLNRLYLQRISFSLKERELFILCGFIFLAPLLSSLANRGRLDILNQEEFKSWTKALMVCPFLYFSFKSPKRRHLLIDVVLFSLVVFEIVFLYRYFVWGEAREFDLRPLIEMKNGDPNFICTFLALGVPLAIYRSRSLGSVSNKGLVLLMVALTLFFIYGAAVTQSRMGLISVVASLIYLLTKAKLPFSKSATFLFLIGMVAVVTYFYGQSLWHRFETIDDESTHGRLKSYQNGIAMFEQSPWFGKGWDASPNYYFQHTGYPLFRSDPDTHSLAVHDTPLQLLADLGLYGFATYLWLALFTGLSIAYGSKRNDTMAVCCGAAFLALVLNFLTLPLATKDFGILFLGLLATLTQREGELTEKAIPLSPSSSRSSIETQDRA